MEFIDRTGHIFSLPHFSSNPIGYEFDENPYVFWFDNMFGPNLSVDCYYIKPIKLLLPIENEKEISKLTGVSIRALRYYDEIGLLVPTMRNEAGYRLYDEKALEKLNAILFLRGKPPKNRFRRSADLFPQCVVMNDLEYTKYACVIQPCSAKKSLAACMKTVFLRLPC